MRCPQCHGEVAAAGQLDFEGDRLIVYQCDRCVRPWEFAGESFDAALTFAVDGSGRFIDPETSEPLPIN
jgi:hypothetical protein